MTAGRVDRPSAIAQIIDPNAWLLGSQQPRRDKSLAQALQILALFDKEGLILRPAKATDAMCRAARPVILAREFVKPNWTLGQHCQEAFGEIPHWAVGSERLTHIDKGDCAAMVYDAMCQAYSGAEKADADLRRQGIVDNAD